MPSFLTDQLEPVAIYKLLVGAILPRPIAFVSTLSADGTPNLAPFSFFTVASSYPPILAFAPQNASGPTPGVGLPKDTLVNLRATGECVIHIVSYTFREEMNLTSGTWPAEISEFDMSGLTPIPATYVNSPRVQEARIAFECVLDQILSWGDHPRGGNLITVRVVAIHIDEAVYDDGKIDVQALDPIGRMGGPSYVRAKDAAFEMERPSSEWVQEALSVRKQ